MTKNIFNDIQKFLYVWLLWPRAVLLLKEFWQGNDQGKGFFARAFALACPGVAPPLQSSTQNEMIHKMIKVFGPLQGHPSYYICKTCHSYLKRDKIPPQAAINDLTLDDVPKELTQVYGIGVYINCSAYSFHAHSSSTTRSPKRNSWCCC